MIDGLVVVVDIPSLREKGGVEDLLAPDQEKDLLVRGKNRSRFYYFSENYFLFFNQFLPLKIKIFPFYEA